VTRAVTAVALLLLATGPARANCFPPKSFSQIGLQFSQYVLSPSRATATTDSVIGRFWQPGARQTTGEGTCDETRWLTRCYDCTPDHTGPVYYVDGVLGQMPCFSGCPQGSMIVLLQDRVPQAGGLFAVGRVTEIPSGVPRFDFSRIEEDWRLIPIPAPNVSITEPEAGTLRVGVTFPDPALGYFGLENTRASDTITAIHLLTWEGISPPADRSAWTTIGRFTYRGGITTGSANIEHACPGSDESIRFIAGALELDGGQVVTDYVSAPVPVSCTALIPAGAGRLPESGPDALSIARDPAGDLHLAWGAACAPAAPTFEVYAGELGSWDDLSPVTCGIADNALVLTPPQGSTYYLVVPYANRVRPPQVEGSYGVRGDGSERPPSAFACRPQWIVPCP